MPSDPKPQSRPCGHTDPRSCDMACRVLALEDAARSATPPADQIAALLGKHWWDQGADRCACGEPILGTLLDHQAARLVGVTVVPAESPATILRNRVADSLVRADREKCWNCGCPNVDYWRYPSEEFCQKASVPAESGLREALEWLRGSEDSIGRFMRSPNGDVVRLDDVLAVLRLAHTWPPDALADGRGVCSDCGALWPCSSAVEAGSALRAAPPAAEGLDES